MGSSATVLRLVEIHIWAFRMSRYQSKNDYTTVYITFSSYKSSMESDSFSFIALRKLFLPLLHKNQI